MESLGNEPKSWAWRLQSSCYGAVCRSIETFWHWSRCSHLNIGLYYFALTCRPILHGSFSCANFPGSLREWFFSFPFAICQVHFPPLSPLHSFLITTSMLRTFSTHADASWICVLPYTVLRRTRLVWPPECPNPWNSSMSETMHPPHLKTCLAHHVS